VAGCCECGDEPLGSCATELVSIDLINVGIIMVHSSRGVLPCVCMCEIKKARKGRPEVHFGL
jgi:hypothetical protein